MRTFILPSLLLFSITAFAQNEKAAAKAVRINFFSSIGLGTIDKKFAPATGNSIQTATGIELRFTPASSAGISVAFDSYGYQLSGNSYALDGSLKATGLAAFYRYRFGSSSVRPYLKAGVGGTWLSVPTVSVAQGFTTVKKEVQFISLVSGEAGLQFRLHPRYSFFVGAERGWMANSSLLNASLRSTTFKIGLVSSL